MNLNFGYILIILIIIVASVILHELAHGVVAYWLGDSTAKDAGRLTLNPIKHIDPYMSILVPVVLYILNAPVFGGAKPVPINPNNLKWKEWGMALVAVADVLCTTSVRAIRELEPKLVVAMGNVDAMVSDLKLTARTEKKLKIKNLDSLPATKEVVVLN